MVHSIAVQNKLFLIWRQIKRYHDLLVSNGWLCSTIMGWINHGQQLSGFFVNWEVTSCAMRCFPLSVKYCAYTEHNSRNIKKILWMRSWPLRVPEPTYIQKKYSWEMNELFWSSVSIKFKRRQATSSYCSEISIWDIKVRRRLLTTSIYGDNICLV